MDSDSFIAIYDSPYTGRTVAYCGPEGFSPAGRSLVLDQFSWARLLANWSKLELVDFTREP